MTVFRTQTEHEEDTILYHVEFISDNEQFFTKMKKFCELCIQKEQKKNPVGFHEVR